MITPERIILILSVCLLVVFISLYASTSCKKYPIGFSPEFSRDAHPEMLDLSKIQSCKFDASGNYKLSGPVTFPSGIFVYNDQSTAVTPQDISGGAGGYVYKYTIDDLVKLGKEDLQKIIHDPTLRSDVQAHMQEIQAYLKDNASATDVRDVYAHLENIMTYLDDQTHDFINNVHDFKDMVSKYIQWIKFILSKGGGAGAVLKNLRPAIKQQFYINMLALSATPNGDTVNSGTCSLAPYSMWQTCPDGYAPIGSLGYKEKDSPCTHWYQRFSGSLLCGKTANARFDTLGKCQKIQKWYTFIHSQENPKLLTLSDHPEITGLREEIASVISEVLQVMDSVPKVQVASGVIRAIYNKHLSTVEQIHDILLDMVDVCQSFSACEPGKTCDFKAADVQKVISRSCTEGNTECATPTTPVMLQASAASSSSSSSSSSPGYLTRNYFF